MSKVQEIIRWVEDHYWDSLESQKDLILQHLHQCPALESEPEPVKKFTYKHSKGCMRLSTDSECSCGVRRVEQKRKIENLQAEMLAILQRIENWAGGNSGIDVCTLSGEINKKIKELEQAR